MAKQAISLTLSATNLLWLKGQARSAGGGSLSEAVDRLLTDARTGRLGLLSMPKSVVGSIDLGDDPLLLQADQTIRSVFTGSLSRPLVVQEDPPTMTSKKKAAKRSARG